MFEESLGEESLWRKHWKYEYCTLTGFHFHIEFVYMSVQAGHVYMVDFKVLEGIPTPEGRFVTPAMGMFYVNAADGFLPLAIQLYQKPGIGNPIWTPQDTQPDWLCAKFFLKCADAQV